MQLLVRNDLGEMFKHNCDYFDGFEIFELANDYWDNNWQSYSVIENDAVIENVINPNYLDPQSARTLH